MMYSAYKSNKQGDNIQPWCTPFLIWNLSVDQFKLLLPDLHTGFSRGRSGGQVFPCLSEFSTVYCGPHSPLERVSFNSNPKERQWQRMFKLLHNCTYLTHSEWVSEIAQSCPTPCDPMDYSLSGSSIHGIFQARVLEWIAISFSRGSSWPRNWTQVSRIVGRRFTVWATREIQEYWSG